ncbi:MAG: hypothetical protein J6D28_05780 [Bacilli bacterium]|nr:hypothetical protein [Bacilli bacterium]
MRDKNQEVKYLDYQIIISLIVIVTVILSIVLTYNEKLELLGKKTLFNKKMTHNISYINRLTILITGIIFLYINYRLYQISKEEGEDLKNYYLQIIASILTIIAAYIAFYVVTRETDLDSVSDVENPII